MAKRDGSLSKILCLTGCGSFTKGILKKASTRAFVRAAVEKPPVKKGASTGHVANQYCECTLAKFKETKSMDKSAEVCAAQVKSNPPAQ